MIYFFSFSKRFSCKVDIELDKMRIIEFNDGKFTVSVSLFLAVHWSEVRLQAPPPSPTAPYQAG